MLAQQMASAGRPGSVTWLDRSGHARKVATARAQARKLENIAFEEGSILDLPRSGLGPFDYIDCCGVLHHLPDPAEGLAALASVLAPGGGIGLMVYAPHGRTGVYMLQDALRLLAPAENPPPARVEVAKRLWKALPGLDENNPLSRVVERMTALDREDRYDSYEALLNDLQSIGNRCRYLTRFCQSPGCFQLCGRIGPCGDLLNELRQILVLRGQHRLRCRYFFSRRLGELAQRFRIRLQRSRRDQRIAASVAGNFDQRTGLLNDRIRSLPVTGEKSP
jgi:SAM-dependent methyltransferase